ncbi:MAG: sterol carrier family protein [Terrimesophilobacter sp.]
MGRVRISSASGEAAVRACLTAPVDRDVTALAVRYLLQVLSDAAPGNTLEVRVPPFGAMQCVEGPRHTRGTPPNVIELDAATWIALATGSLTWSRALSDDRVAASGSRADLDGLLPLEWNAGE